MKAINFPEANLLLSKEGCEDLPCLRENGYFLSCFKLDAEELAKLQETGQIWLAVWGNGHPPVLIMTEQPFTPAGEILEEKPVDELFQDDIIRE